VSKIRFHFQRTLQLVDFEPIQFGVDYESDAEPSESAEAFAKRVHGTAVDLYNEMQADLLKQFRLPGARTKSSHGGKPPPMKNNDDPAPPPKK